MNDDGSTRIAVAMERISLVLGALHASQMGDLEQGLKAERLSRCGYSNKEIADLLGMTTNAVNVALHRARKGSKGKKVKSE